MTEFNEAAHQAAMIAKAESIRPTGSLSAVDAAAQADDFRAFRLGDQTHRTYQAPVYTSENTPSGTDLLATVKTTSGSPVVGRSVSERDLVVYEGIEMSVGHAIDMGVLYRDQGGNIIPWDGTPRASEGGPEAAPQEPEEGPQESEAFRGDDTTEAAINALWDSPSAATAINDLAFSGEVTAATMSQLAIDLDMAPEAVSTMLATAEEGLRSAAAKACGMADPRDQQAFDAWVYADADRTRAARSAARMVGMYSDLTATKHLVAQWRREGMKRR